MFNVRYKDTLRVLNEYSINHIDHIQKPSVVSDSGKLLIAMLASLHHLFFNIRVFSKLRG